MDQTEMIEELKAKLRDRVDKCFLCKWILGDLEKNGTLTKSYPELCSDGKPLFPVEGKTEHLYLEEFLKRPVVPAPPNAAKA